LNPNDADLLSDMADAMAHSGQSEDAIGLIEKAMRLKSVLSDQYLWHLGGAYFNLRRYDEAVRTVRSMAEPYGRAPAPGGLLCAYGELDEARQPCPEGAGGAPNFSVERWGAVQPDRHDADVEHFWTG